MITYCYVATERAAERMKKLMENQRLGPGLMTSLDWEDIKILREELVAIPVVMQQEPSPIVAPDGMPAAH